MTSLKTTNGITLSIGQYEIEIIKEDVWVICLYVDGKLYGELEASLSGVRRIVEKIMDAQVKKLA